MSPREQARALLLLRRLVEAVERTSSAPDDLVAAAELADLHKLVDEAKSFLDDPPPEESKN